MDAQVPRKCPSKRQFHRLRSWKAYEQAIVEAFGEEYPSERTGKRGRPRRPAWVPPKDLVSATVHKTRVKGRVQKISSRTIFGTDEQVQEALQPMKWKCKELPKNYLINVM